MSNRVFQESLRSLDGSGRLDRRALLRLSAALGIGSFAAINGVRVSDVLAQEADGTPISSHTDAVPVLRDSSDLDAFRNEGGSIPGSVVTVAFPDEPGTLDPQFELSGRIGNYGNPMFHHLLDYDRDFQLHPEAAESVELLDEGRIFRFRLRPGITFWNGEPLDAAAVKFTYERTQNQELIDAGLNFPIHGRQGFVAAHIIDDLTVDLEFAEFRANILALVPLTFLLAPEYYSTHTPEETARQPMGSGPWMFQEWVKDDHMTMVANPNFFLGAPHVETLIYRTIPERLTRISLLETGEVDLVTGVAPDDIDIIESHDNLSVVNTQSTGKIHVQIPMSQPKYQDKRVRKALAMAVDYESIREHVMGGLAGERLTAPVTGSFWTNPEIPPVVYDPEQAKALLAEAAFPMDEQMTLYTASGSFTSNEDIAAAIASNFRDIGLNCQSQVLETTVATQRAREEAFDDLYLSILAGRSFGPDDLNLINQNSSFDSSRWLEHSDQAERFLEVAELAQTSLETETQRQYVFEAHAIFMEESPWILLHREVSLYGVSDRTTWRPTGYSRIHPWLVGEGDIEFVEE